MDSILVFLAGAPAATEGDSLSVVSLIFQADIVVQLVLFMLVAMSVACWAIVLNKFLTIGRALRQSAGFVEMFWKAQRLDEVYERTKRYPHAPVSEVFKAGYVELSKLTAADRGGENAMDLGLTENIERALRRAGNVEIAHLSRLVPFLATTGSTGPFIGLFGTVWGILRAFQRIGVTGNASIQTVGPDISHALIATAVGLLAAIPAVMAYNYFNSRIKAIAGEIDAFSSDFLNIVKRHYRR